MKDSNKIDTKIYWVCCRCGENALALPINKDKKRFSISTYHNGKCDVCLKNNQPVTQTRDFGFPVFLTHPPDGDNKGK